MGEKIRFSCDGHSIAATLNDTAAAAVLFENLPFEGMAATMGASFYMMVEFPVTEEGAVEEVENGAVAFWPATNALTVFYGAEPTTPVVVIGKIEGDPASQCRDILSGTTVTVEKG